MSENNDYSKEYYHLFNTITVQIDALERVANCVPRDEFALSRNIEAVIGALKKAQCETEEIFISNVW